MRESDLAPPLLDETVVALAGAPAALEVRDDVLDPIFGRERERQFTPIAIAYAEGARGEVVATAVPRPFRLMRETEDCTTYLETSAEAVNGLVGGLDILIANRQTALETVLERQLARGELDAAFVTSGYVIQIEELLAETEEYPSVGEVADVSVGRPSAPVPAELGQPDGDQQPDQSDPSHVGDSNGDPRVGAGFGAGADAVVDPVDSK